MADMGIGAGILSFLLRVLTKDAIIIKANANRRGSWRHIYTCEVVHSVDTRYVQVVDDHGCQDLCAHQASSFNSISQTVTMQNTSRCSMSPPNITIIGKRPVK